jgi:hypothetical protein
MFDSDRGDKPKTRLIQSTIFATFFILFLTGWGVWFQLGYHQQATDKSAQYERWSDHEIKTGCPSLGKLTKAECTYQAKQSAHENKRDEYDLYAQRTSALWAGIMAVAALLGIGLSGVGVYLVKTTFDETRKANNIARTQARASILAHDAYLLVPKGGFKPIPPGNTLFPEGAYVFIFECQITNVGMTVAKDVRMIVRLYTIPPTPNGSSSETTYQTCLNEIAKVGDVQNGGPVTKSGTLVSLGNVITAPNATAPAHDGTFYANYRIEFGDVFGQRWFFEANFFGTAGSIKNGRLAMQPVGAQREGKIN